MRMQERALAALNGAEGDTSGLVGDVTQVQYHTHMLGDVDAYAMNISMWVMSMSPSEDTFGLVGSVRGQAHVLWTSHEPGIVLMHGSSVRVKGDDHRHFLMSAHT
jgi:hypothetical protein